MEIEKSILDRIDIPVGRAHRSKTSPHPKRGSRSRLPPTRWPPASEDGLADVVSEWDALAPPEPEYLFDQQVQW